MSAIEFSKLAVDNLSESTLPKAGKKKILEALQRAREDPEEYLSSVAGYPFYRIDIDIDGGYVAIVSWDQDRDVIQLNSFGPREEFVDE